MPSGRERRNSPRKDCVVPIRFRVVASVLSTGQFSDSVDATNQFESLASRRSNLLSAVAGETVNLSERGVYFRSRHAVSVGQPIEMYMTLPRELTGRSPEEVRCSAMVVHVEDHADNQGFTGVGASIDRFEPINVARNWEN